MSFNPKTDYGPDEYFKDVLCEGPVKDVTFTETGIIKEYESGKMAMIDEADNEKRHNTYDFTYDENGNLHGESHSSNS